MTKYEEILKRFQDYANNKGFYITPDLRMLKILIDGMIKNEERYGALLCPCRPKQITGDLSKDHHIICPCVYHLNELDINGACKCRLFVSKNFYDETKAMLEGLDSL